jgi:Fe-Mn family superoxide dismutase
MNFEFKELSKYDYNSLPSISPRALELHHRYHYKTYLDNTNSLTNSDEKNLDLISLIKKHAEILESNSDSNIMQVSRKIFNNAAQVFNHEFYFDSMKINGGGEIPKNYSLYAYIMKKYNNFDNFVKKFKEISLNQFGSGWSWLVFDLKLKEVDIISTSNAFTPITNPNFSLLLGIDVWEHAYYRDFENKRNFYLDKFFEYLIDWEFAENNLKKIALSA